MNAKEIANMLTQDVEEICRTYLSAGKRRGSEWVCGNVNNEPGDSLSVRLDGSKAGVWKDFATGEGGDLLDLYCAVNRCGVADALKWAKSKLNIEQKLPPQKKYVRPAKPKCSRVKTDWLQTERKLKPEAIEAYKIAQQENKIIFPYLRGNELIFAKWRTFPEKKHGTVQEGCEPCLFGWQAIPPKARSVIICEGELDAPSWWQAGYPALSVPTGASGLTWIDNEYENLARFDEIYISFDQDDAGQKAIAQIVDRLGRERCKVITLPVKDANECLQKDIPLEKYYNNAKTLDPEELKPVDYYRNQVIDLFTGRSLTEVGYFMPWAKVQNQFRFRPSELTLVAGVNFHGKSEGVGFLTLDIMRQGGRACVASLELQPKSWIKRMVHQAAGRGDPSEGYLNAIFDWASDKLWAFAERGTAKAQKLLEVFIYARKRYGCDFFVIDNLAKCGYREDDYSGQKEFIDQLTDFVNEHNVHCVLVLHPRKMNDEYTPIGSMDVKGSGGIVDMADNLLIWWRNKKKQKEIEEMKGNNEEVPQDLIEKPDAMVYVEKQRHDGENLPAIKLWFDPRSHQFLPSYNAPAKQYVRYSEYESNRDSL